jgi:hypothetical protein
MLCYSQLIINQMKITIKEDGSLKIDGENNYAKTDTGIVLKHDGYKAHFFTDFIKIDGDKENDRHEIVNFVFKAISNELVFGNELLIENQPCIFIGIQNNNRIFWNTEKNQIVFGYTKNEADKLKPIKVRRRFFNWL